MEALNVTNPKPHTNSSDNLVSVRHDALSRLLNIFLSVHLHSGDIEQPAKRWLEKDPNDTIRLLATLNDSSSSIAPWSSSPSAIPVEFGAPVQVATAAPREDVELLLSVMLTTACVFLCFLLLLTVKCCANLCCIDLLYCIAHCGRRPPTVKPDPKSAEPVVLRLLPDRASLERLLREEDSAKKKAGPSRFEKKTFYLHSV
ncbi:hypothetical protein HPB49_025924 [Dermacentor silvarum]|uniref:Uncharacterized protein n=2 Tax=Dermacentor silvarum TaxID=543639 RepID=A0ACB8D3A7_DERSI|nr:uncharacterized protein LOC125941761 [Dermacentor silvarum]KAH7958954.1 hypothetical protein HPB49_006909 [Dermacentor silvarum]KAH7986529.1 hypothetical protein HPB49_025924 [Dermacentor silvarum]